MLGVKIFIFLTFVLYCSIFVNLKPDFNIITTKDIDNEVQNEKDISNRSGHCGGLCPPGMRCVADGKCSVLGSACDECARTGILDSEGSRCPLCSDVASPEELIPWRKFRDKVNKFCNQTGYNKATPNPPVQLKVSVRPTLPDFVLPDQACINFNCDDLTWNEATLGDKVEPPNFNSASSTSTNGSPGIVVQATPWSPISDFPCGPYPPRKHLAAHTPGSTPPQSPGMPTSSPQRSRSPSNGSRSSGTPYSHHNGSCGRVTPTPTTSPKHSKAPLTDNSIPPPMDTGAPNPTLLPPGHVLAPSSHYLPPQLASASTYYSHPTVLNPAEDPLAAFEAAMRKLDSKKASRGRLGPSSPPLPYWVDRPWSRPRERYSDYRERKYSPQRRSPGGYRCYSPRRGFSPRREDREFSRGSGPRTPSPIRTWDSRNKILREGKTSSPGAARNYRGAFHVSLESRQRRFVTDIPPESEEEMRDREWFERELDENEIYQEEWGRDEQYTSDKRAEKTKGSAVPTPPREFLEIEKVTEHMGKEADSRTPSLSPESGTDQHKKYIRSQKGKQIHESDKYMGGKEEDMRYNNERVHSVMDKEEEYYQSILGTEKDYEISREKEVDRQRKRLGSLLNVCNDAEKQENVSEIKRNKQVFNLPKDRVETKLPEKDLLPSVTKWDKEDILTLEYPQLDKNSVDAKYTRELGVAAGQSSLPQNELREALEIMEKDDLVRMKKRKSLDVSELENDDSLHSMKKKKRRKEKGETEEESSEEETMEKSKKKKKKKSGLKITEKILKKLVKKNLLNKKALEKLISGEVKKKNKKKQDSGDLINKEAKPRQSSSESEDIDEVCSQGSKERKSTVSVDERNIKRDIAVRKGSNEDREILLQRNENKRDTSEEGREVNSSEGNIQVHLDNSSSRVLAQSYVDTSGNSLTAPGQVESVRDGWEGGRGTARGRISSPRKSIKERLGPYNGVDTSSVRRDKCRDQVERNVARVGEDKMVRRAAALLAVKDRLVTGGNKGRKDRDVGEESGQKNGNINEDRGIRDRGEAGGNIGTERLGAVPADLQAWGLKSTVSSNSPTQYVITRDRNETKSGNLLWEDDVWKTNKCILREKKNNSMERYKSEPGQRIKGNSMEERRKTPIMEKTPKEARKCENKQNDQAVAPEGLPRKKRTNHRLTNEADRSLDSESD